MGFRDPKDSGDPVIRIELPTGEVIDPLALVDELFYTMDAPDKRKSLSFWAGPQCVCTSHAYWREDSALEDTQHQAGIPGGCELG